MATSAKRSRKARGDPIWMARLHIALLDVQPTVWRVVQVPLTIPLDKLHQVIQAAMGWTDSHLHEFVINGARYGVNDPHGFDDDRVVEERGVTLRDALSTAARTFDYVYDFGDNWHHAITVESVGPLLPGPTGLVCLAGERACPPEDVGGGFGYDDFLEAITDPGHSEHEHLLEWTGGEFDPERFDIELANARLGHIKI